MADWAALSSIEALRPPPHGSEEALKLVGAATGEEAPQPAADAAADPAELPEQVQTS